VLLVKANTKSVSSVRVRHTVDMTVTVDQCCHNITNLE